MKIREKQTVCEWIGVTPNKPEPDSIIGLAIDSIEEGTIHGLRHSKVNNSNGWYVWSGEYSNSPDFFKPICYKHIDKYLDKSLIEYFDLPEGYRFLVDAPNYEDVWYDEKLLKL